jgi:predicted aminopeptidase
LATIAFLVWNFGALTYGLAQGYGQLKVLWGAQNIEAAIASGQYKPEQISKIRLITEIKNFAFDSLGLLSNRSYTKIYNQKGEPLIWLVVGCEPFRLEPKTWNFPFLGSFSYKGFFSKNSAQKQAADLAKQGYDTLIRPVSAWSTLGLLADPILSEMLNLEPGDLAELIIHELTHGTIYLKSSVEYNENLANFIGVEGAKMFLKSHYGASSKELADYLNALSYQQLYTKKIVDFASELDAIYRKKSRLPELKAQKMKEFKDWVMSQELFSKKFKEKFAQKQLNNAYFYAFLQYNEGQSDFEKEFENEAGSDLVRYIAYLRKKHGNSRLFF